MEKCSDKTCQSSDKTCQNCVKLLENDRHYRGYISSISHEIRNSLTLLHSSLQMIEKEYAVVTESCLWSQIREDLRVSIQLLKEVSTLNSDHPLTLSPISLRDFLTGLEFSVAPLMKERRISLTVECEAEPVTILADPPRLQEVVVNLLLNAADALDSTSQNVRTIRLYTSKRNGVLCIHVKDNGPGIPAEYLHTLFDPFVTHKSNGTGLGLAIARSILQKHGGTISVDTSTSQPNTWSDFCLRLPISEQPLQFAGSPCRFTTGTAPVICHYS